MKMILIAVSLVVASCSSSSFNGERNCRLEDKQCNKTPSSARMPQAFEYMSQTRK